MRRIKIRSENCRRGAVLWMPDEDMNRRMTGKRFYYVRFDKQI
jgi:RNA binding exosome subunit